MLMSRKTNYGIVHRSWIQKLVYEHVKYLVHHKGTAISLALIPFLAVSFCLSTRCNFERPQRIVEWFNEHVQSLENLPASSMNVLFDNAPDKFPNKPAWYTGIPVLYTQPIVLIDPPGLHDCGCTEMTIDTFRQKLLMISQEFNEMISEKNQVNTRILASGSDDMFSFRLCMSYKTLNLSTDYSVGLLVAESPDLLEYGQTAIEHSLDRSEFRLKVSRTRRPMEIVHVFCSNLKPINRLPLMFLFILVGVYVYHGIKSIAPNKHCFALSLYSTGQLVVSVYYASKIEQCLNEIPPGYDPVSGGLFVAVLVGLENTVSIVGAIVQEGRRVPPTTVSDNIAYGYAQYTRKFAYQFIVITFLSGIGACFPVLKMQSFAICLLLAICIQTILHITSFVAMLAFELSDSDLRSTFNQTIIALVFIFGIVLVSTPTTALNSRDSTLRTKNDRYGWVINTLKIDHRSRLNHRYFTIIQDPAILIEATSCAEKSGLEIASNKYRPPQNPQSMRFVSVWIITTTLAFLTATVSISIVNGRHRLSKQTNESVTTVRFRPHLLDCVLGISARNDRSEDSTIQDDFDLFGYDTNSDRLFIASLCPNNSSAGQPFYLFRKVAGAGQCTSFAKNDVRAVFGFECGHMFSFYNSKRLQGQQRLVRWTLVSNKSPILSLCPSGETGFYGCTKRGGIFLSSSDNLKWLDETDDESVDEWNRECAKVHEIAIYCANKGHLKLFGDEDRTVHSFLIEFKVKRIDVKSHSNQRDLWILGSSKTRENKEFVNQYRFERNQLVLQKTFEIDNTCSVKKIIPLRNDELAVLYSNGRLEIADSPLTKVLDVQYEPLTETFYILTQNEIKQFGRRRKRYPIKLSAFARFSTNAQFIIDQSCVIRIRH